MSFPSGESSSASKRAAVMAFFERLAYLIYEGSAAEPRRLLKSDMA